MNTPAETNFAWQPLTPRGVAAFARAQWGRLLLVQCVFAVLAAASVVWFVNTAWFPTIRDGIRSLPARGELDAGALNWPTNSPQLLAEGPFLAFVVDLDHAETIRSPAQFQIEFGRDTVRVYSLLGFVEQPYTKKYLIPFNQPDLEPWWGAWATPILWMTFGAIFAALMAGWFALATLYFFPAWLAGFFSNRALTPAGSWKLAGAALLPGALLMTLALLTYGFGILDLVKLAAAFAAHILCGWIFLFAAVGATPKISETAVPKANPFTPPANAAPAPPAQKSAGENSANPP
jgi:hypothetical protein